MESDYLAFVASAYGLSALALLMLGLWILLDARSVKARLRRLEAAGLRRRSAEPGETGPADPGREA